MSKVFLDSCLVPTDVLAARLRLLSKAITERNMSEFTMRVPAEVDRDADLVLAEAARRLLEMNEISEYDTPAPTTQAEST